MAKKGENIYKRKDGRWEGRYIQYYDKNKKAKYGYVYAKTYSETKQKLLEKRMTPSYSAPASNLSYNTLLDIWLQSTKINVKESTYAQYHHLINSHIRPFGGNYPISMLTTQQIEFFIEQKLVNGRLNNNGALSPKTVSDIPLQRAV